MAAENDFSPNSICWRLSPRSFFYWKKESDIKVQPVIVDFQRLLSSNLTAVDWVCNKDLLHAVVGLYDTCLPDITPEILYSTVCAKWSKTLILVRDREEVLRDMATKYQHGDHSNVSSASETAKQTTNPKQNDKPSQQGTQDKSTKPTTKDNEQNVAAGQKSSESKVNKNSGTELSSLKEVCNLEGEQEKEEKKDSEEEEERQKFDGVFSDTESEASPESDEEDDGSDDYSAGVDDFISAARKRHEQRLQGEVSTKSIGIESCIVGCLTFERSYSKPSEKLLLLQLLSVRKRYRKCGVGRYLVNCIRDPTLVGPYDTVVVHADREAVDFFKTQNFNDDVILNSRFSHVSDLWDNSTLMCYLPPFTGSDLSTGAYSGISGIISMEEEMKKWKEKSIEAYQAQMTCMVRLQHEIKTLKAMVENQDEMILSMKIENETLQCEKFQIEKEYLEYRLKNRIGLMMELNAEEDTEDEDKLLNALISSQGRDQITTDFIQSMKKDRIYSTIQVQDIRKVELNLMEDFRSKLDTRMQQLGDRDMALKLYFCGGTGQQLERILTTGFTEADTIEGLFGRGLYFSHHACKAAQFSAPGLVLVARVGVGKVESVLQKNPQRQSPPDGFDSVITPGRESYPPLQNSDNQEYVIFDHNQAIPLYIIEYTVTRT